MAEPESCKEIGIKNVNFGEGCHRGDACQSL